MDNEDRADVRGDCARGNGLRGKRWKLWTAALVAVAVGGVTAVRGATLEPFLDVSYHFVFATDAYEVWGVRVAARGGSRISQVSLDVPPPTRVTDWPMYGPIAFDGAHDFKIQIPLSEPRPVTVRVTQLGPVVRIYDVHVAAPNR